MMILLVLVASLVASAISGDHPACYTDEECDGLCTQSQHVAECHMTGTDANNFCLCFFPMLEPEIGDDDEPIMERATDHSVCTVDSDCDGLCTVSQHVAECHDTGDGNGADFCLCYDPLDTAFDDEPVIVTRTTTHAYCESDVDCETLCPDGADGVCRLNSNSGGHNHCICPDGSHAG